MKKGKTGSKIGLTNQGKLFILKNAYKRLKNVINFPCSRGVSGALYLQSATVGVMSCPGFFVVELPFASGVDVRVLRNRNL